MKNNCNVARDLMPLVIDGVASEESQKYVDEHIAECTDCTSIYCAMKVELTNATEQKERVELENTAKRLRRKRILRVLAGGLTGVLVFLALYLGVPRVMDVVEENRFRQRYLCENGDIRLDGLYYNVCMDERRAPVVQVNIYSFPSGSPNFEAKFEFVPINGNTEICVQFRAVYAADDSEYASYGTNFWAGRVEDGKWLGLADGLYDAEGKMVSLPIVRIELHAGDDYVVLWEEGDVVQTVQEAWEKIEAAQSKYE